MQVSPQSKERLSDISEQKQSSRLFHTFSPCRKTELAVITGLILLLALFRFKLFLLTSSHYLGSIDGDAGLYAWLLKTNPYDLFNLPWFEKYAFYPYSKVLAWSDNFILPSIIAGPLSLLGLTDPLVFNLVILLAGLLNGYFTFKLCFLICGEAFASFFSGAAFMTLPYLTHQLGHPQIQFFFWIPICLIATINYLNKPSLFCATKIGFFISCTFLSTVFYAVFCSIAVAALVVSIWILRPLSFRPKELSVLAGGIACGLLPLIPFVIPYLAVQSTFGARGIYEAYYFSASLWSYLSSAPHNLIYAKTAILSEAESHLFPGLVLFALSYCSLLRISDSKSLRLKFAIFILIFCCACVASVLPASQFKRSSSTFLLWAALVQFILLIRHLGKLETKLNFHVITGRSLCAIFGFIGLLFFIISFGPIGNPEKGQMAFSPFRFFYTFLPGFSSIRAISRTGIVVLFSLSILSGLFLSHLYKKKAWRGVSFLALGFVLLENFNIDFPLSNLVPAPDNFATLASSRDQSAALVVLPLTTKLDKNSEVESWSDYARLNMTYVLWSGGRRAMLNGHSGQKTKIMRDYPRELKDFPNSRSIKALGRIAGLRYIIYCSQFHDGFDSTEFEAKLELFPSQLQLISKDSSGTYLLKLNEEISNLARDPIYLPAVANKLTFEVRSGFKSAKQELQVKIFVPEISEEDPVTSFKITPDGNWRKVSVELDKIANTARSVSLLMRAEDETPIIIRDSSIN